MTPKVKQWMRDAAKELVYSVRGWGTRSPEFMTQMVEKWSRCIASHAPSAINRNDTIEYWMTRATTAELKLQEFAKLLDENEPEHAFDAIASPDPGPTCSHEISARSAAEVGGSMADQLNEPEEYGYCSQAKTVPHVQRKECINWTPEIEHDH